jgi:hypothetical protein
MMRAIFTVVFSVFAAILWGQETDTIFGANFVEEKLFRQLKLFPQEKIHIHTDKSTYVAGEKIWYRAYVVDAILNRPTYLSRYVYVELISPAGELISLDKIRPVDSLFHNHVNLAEDLAEGTYMLRAYTNFMRNRPDYFFEKKIFIADPQSSSIHIIPKFELKNNKASLRIEFHKYGDQEINVENLKLRVDTGKVRKIDIDKDFAVKTSKDFSFKTLSNAQQMVYLEFDSDGRRYKKYISVPKEENDFDVSFFPEGGYLIDDTHCKLAFKALKPNGLSEDVTGDVFDNNDTLVTSVSSRHAGMGYFSFFPEKGKTYYAIFKNKSGEAKRFQLPSTQPNAGVLKVSWSRSKLYITILKGAEFVERPLNLIIHTRGILIYAGALPKSNILSIDKAMLPSGVSQILLLDDNMNPISERLIFNLNTSELAKVEISTNKPTGYKRREHVSAKVRVSDIENKPLEGDFSVSVTDNKDIIPDSMFTIVSSLLLCSDIRGYIESPEYYVKNQLNTDALLLTQGWKRYNIPAVLKDSLEKPVHYMELGQEISGTVERVLGSKVNVNNSVSIFSINAGYANMAMTDENGRFYFNGFEFPDSTVYIIQALSKKGNSYVELLVDKETFPEIKPFAVPDFQLDSLLLRYIEKSDRKYIEENGSRAIELETVTITGQKTEPRKQSIYSSMMNTVITSDKFERYTDLYQALMTVGGIMITGDKISIRGSSTPPVIIIDDVIWEDVDLRDINIMDVETIEIMKGAEAAVLGSKGAGGAIILTTKRGDITPKKGIKFNMKTIMPKGYRKDVEFYSPKYETEDEQTKEVDRRTTIFWKPNIKISEGNAEFDFYTADSNSSYSVIIEGITTDGRIIKTLGTINENSK